MTAVRLNAIALLAWIGAAIWALPHLPERYPIHFDLAGNPDGWATRSLLSWLLLPIIGVVSGVFMHAVARLAANRPNTWNIPEKKTFLALRDEQRRPIMASLVRFLDAVALGVTALLASVHAGMFLAATGRTSGLHWFFMAVTFGFTGITLWAALSLNRRIRERIITASMTGGPT